MNETAMDNIFHALANSVRRQALDIIKACPGCSVNEVSEHFTISRIAVMKHLGVLEESGLITSRKSGRTRRLYFNAVPIQLIYDRWTDEYSQFWASKMADWKYKLEKEHADDDGGQPEECIHDSDRSTDRAGVE